MEGRIACMTTGNPVTMGKTESREGGRRYHMPPPGLCYRWDARACEPEITEHQGKYGLVIIEDFRIVTLDPMSRTGRDFEERFADGYERAKDLARIWAKYGGVLLTGAAPTAEDVHNASRARENFARVLINRCNYNYKCGQAGKAGFHAEYEPVAKAWAAEYKIQTPDELPKNADKRDMPDDAGRVPCPECAEMIKAEAKRCRYCGAGLTPVDLNVAATEALSVMREQQSVEVD